MWRSGRTAAGGCRIAGHKRTVPRVAQLPLCNAARQSSAAAPPHSAESRTHRLCDKLYHFCEQAYVEGSKRLRIRDEQGALWGSTNRYEESSGCVLSIGGKETQVRKAARSCGEGTVRLVRRRLLGWLASEIRLRNPTALCFHGRSKNGRRNCI